ncbi:DUF3800 domain-containing protein [Sunxiuqinia elliptica]|uniref:DUF3800 domain-containing protein n=1 Tax=Sunxiuqinia elliptica TaxID=655355 RepID=A0A1I2A5C7_9BACT|nr:DUF3800 domain-containing protein [Sunxiuqinia elliptica]SFE38093.1 hypothetical protein SAMN05216283_1012 [Sunxiuqinia elliptica]
MILGIDEVGDFAINSEQFHFFLVVQLDQNKNGIEIKKKQFSDWLKTIPEEKINDNGEVKGTDLTDEELYEFAKHVIAADPITRILQVRVVPAENPPELIEKFKEIEIGRIQGAIEYYQKHGNQQIAKDLQKLTYWYKNRNYQHFLKMLVLHRAISEALNETIGISILLSFLPGNEEEKNLLNIKLKIDRDFINGPQPRIFWGEILRNAIREYSQAKPIPVLDTWKDTGHPFLEKYKTPDGKLNFKDILKENCHFFHSHEHFEIQMADIAGNIVHRYQNRGRCKDAYDKLVEPIRKEQIDIIHLKLNPNPTDDNEIFIE